MLCSLAFAACIAFDSKASPQPMCSDPNSDARVIKVVAPDVPDSAVGFQASLVTLVLVTVGKDGTVSDASVYKSSGRNDLDAATIEAARKSAYAPKIENCAATDGYYLYRAIFNDAPGDTRE